MQIRWLICSFLLTTLGVSANENYSRAVAILKPVKGYQAKGVVTFTKRPQGVIVDGTFQGLSPGKHALQIYAKGECTPPGISTAGAHYNPLGQFDHVQGAPKAFIADLGFIEADAKGNATFSYFSPHLKECSLLGQSLILNGRPHDFERLPAGPTVSHLSLGRIIKESSY